MANPFLYPKSKHTRTQAPPTYSNYRRYKPSLQAEFFRRCVYCQALDSVKGYEAFAVEHYKPKKRFPELETVYANLYYACNRCNSYKGNYWPSAEQQKIGMYVPNPCDYVMFEHLRYRGGMVHGVSPAGRWTAEKLDLNDPEAVKVRSAFVTVFDDLERRIKVARETRADIARALRGASIGSAKHAALVELQQEADENVQHAEEDFTAIFA